MEKKSNAEIILDLLIKASGLGLLIFLIVWHVVVDHINLTLLAIPALMIGLDIRDVFNLKK